MVGVGGSNPPAPINKSVAYAVIFLVSYSVKTLCLLSVSSIFAFGMVISPLLMRCSYSGAVLSIFFMSDTYLPLVWNASAAWSRDLSLACGIFSTSFSVPLPCSLPASTCRFLASTAKTFSNSTAIHALWLELRLRLWIFWLSTKPAGLSPSFEE
jgi:hypothetical protein